MRVSIKVGFEDVFLEACMANGSASYVGDYPGDDKEEKGDKYFFFPLVLRVRDMKKEFLYPYEVSEVTMQMFMQDILELMKEEE